MKTKLVPLFLFCFFALSCNHGGNLNSFKNNTTFDVTVTVEGINKVTRDSFEVKAGETATYGIIMTGESFSLTRPAVAKIDRVGGYTYDINPVPAIPYMSLILNQLPCDITLKDKTYHDWSVTVTANSSEKKLTQLYSDETHDFYIDGSKTENGFTYVEYQDVSGNTKKAWFTIVEDQTKIIVKNP